MGQTKDFFISYTKTDKAWAEWIACELQEAGYTCTIQARDFVPGQSFIQRMRQALVESRHLVAILVDPAGISFRRGATRLPDKAPHPAAPQEAQRGSR
jgi:hypothetical protein